MVMGDVVGWTDLEELRDWDLFTFTFGDQDRLYLRGQWTVHRNIAKVNHMYRHCSFLTGRSLLSRLQSGARQESAEGCYAFNIASSSDLRVKYDVKAFTDAAGGPSINAEVLYMDGQVRHVKGDLVDQPQHVREALVSQTSEGREDHDHGARAYLVLTPPFHKKTGPTQNSKLDKHRDCHMYWMNPRYRTCLAAGPGLRDVLKLDQGHVTYDRFQVQGHKVHFTSYILHFTSNGWNWLHGIHPNPAMISFPAIWSPSSLILSRLIR